MQDLTDEKCSYTNAQTGKESCVQHRYEIHNMCRDTTTFDSMGPIRVYIKACSYEQGSQQNFPGMFLKASSSAVSGKRKESVVVNKTIVGHA